MNGFENVTSTPSAPLDSSKHVKYSTGMVMGVDDFEQEFAYLSGRDQQMMRDLVGYGTVCGLRVTTDADARGPRVTVAAGVALSPRGQFIKVTPAQCASINDWLAAQKDELARRIGSPAGNSAKLYVTLCYRECPTDQVPIPGEPCRTESEATAASRLTDDFKLSLSFDPPDQSEEDAVRDFVEWMHAIPIVDAVSSVSLEEFLDRIRTAGEPGSPAWLPDYTFGSPASSIQIGSSDACEYFRAAFQLWVTELRPKWRKKNCDAVEEGCLLLAELDVPLSAGWRVSDAGSVTVNQDRRPYVIHLRMLQEWSLCGRACNEGELKASDTVVSEVSSGQHASAGVANTFSRGDHTHGSPDLKLVGDVGGSLGDNTVTAIRSFPVDKTHPTTNDVLTFNGRVWKPTAPSQTVTLQGDVTGAPATNKVEKIQNFPVNPANPVKGYVLASDGHQWIPAALTGDVTGSAIDNAVVGMQKFEVVKPTPEKDDGKVLTFLKKQWVLQDLKSNPVVAAGCFDAQGATTSLPYFSFPRDFVATPMKADARLFYLKFNAFNSKGQFVVKGTPITSATGPAQTFEVVPPNDEFLRKYMPVEHLDPSKGLVVRVMQVDGKPTSKGFMVEISLFA